MRVECSGFTPRMCSCLCSEVELTTYQVDMYFELAVNFLSPNTLAMRIHLLEYHELFLDPHYRHWPQCITSLTVQLSSI